MPELLLQCALSSLTRLHRCQFNDEGGEGLKQHRLDVTFPFCFDDILRVLEGDLAVIDGCQGHRYPCQRSHAKPSDDCRQGLFYHTPGHIFISLSISFV